MIVSSTEVQNNFGKYLMLEAKEDVVITRNGTVVAKLSALDDAVSGSAGETKLPPTAKGIAHNPFTLKACLPN